MLQASASMMSFLPNDGFGNPPTKGKHDERNIHDENRSAETHVPTTIPEVRLYRYRVRKAGLPISAMR
jgi:hypothetical protein